MSAIRGGARKRRGIVEGIHKLASQRPESSRIRREVGWLRGGARRTPRDNRRRIEGELANAREIVVESRVARAFPRRLAHAWLALSLALLAVYAPVLGYDYLNYDDDLYVTANPVVRAGLSASGALWAFTTFHSFNWHPLTWLSLMLDTSLLGLEPGPRHAMNALLHALNTALLYLALARLTGARGRSLAVASLFALHPVQVEPVAWISARKDLLAALCFLLALRAYASFAEGKRACAGLGVLAAFVAGLLCKPVVVTLPFVLLLLDVWPLRRVDPTGPGAARALLRLSRREVAALRPRGAVQRGVLRGPEGGRRRGRPRGDPPGRAPRERGGRLRRLPGGPALAGGARDPLPVPGPDAHAGRESPPPSPAPRCSGRSPSARSARCARRPTSPSVGSGSSACWCR